jgi:FO synthase
MNARDLADWLESASDEALAARRAGELMPAARALRDEGHGDLVTYSPKVFIPLTHLCRDVCHYCTFARPPRRGERAYMSAEEVLAVARAGAAAGCTEALFTLGDKPELRYRVAREELAARGHAATLDLLAAMARLVLDETGLLPHLNPGVMRAVDIARLRSVSVSQGLMLESTSERLLARGGPHFGSPDKRPAARLATLEAAGAALVPFTTGILIGIGETRRERIEALLAIRDLHARHGHIQEVIVQSFRAKPGTRMADAPEPSLDELLWTVAAARLLLGATMSIQVPPNLSPGEGELEALIAAGIDDWGGVSPVTPDHVNPEAPWPHLRELERRTRAAGKTLAPRLAIRRSYLREPERWVDAGLLPAVRRLSDASGLARAEAWAPGLPVAPPASTRAWLDGAAPGIAAGHPVRRILDRVADGADLDGGAIERLFEARGPALAEVCRAADALRRELHGGTVTYAVNRNINYTNICYFHCSFCAFSKGRIAEHLRGAPYLVSLDEIRRRSAEAWARGATEICLQGGIHPDYTGDTYLAICRAVKEAAPGLHVHAFSPLEVTQGAATLGLDLRDYLLMLKDSGLGSLPGTAAEVLDDEVRRIICPDKIDTEQWLRVMRTAHGIGLRTTSTIMFGHVDRPVHWARHLVRLRELQKETGGFTELVPLPFVHMEAPVYRKGGARQGPTFREAVLMHAVARLALHRHIPHIQVSWVKMGEEGVRACLAAGVDDLGGTLMNESISRAAGTTHGQEMPPARMEAVIRGAGRVPAQRTTLYGTPPEERIAASFAAAPLTPPVNDPPHRRRVAALTTASG